MAFSKESIASPGFTKQSLPVDSWEKDTTNWEDIAVSWNKYEQNNKLREVETYKLMSKSSVVTSAFKFIWWYDFTSIEDIDGIFYIYNQMPVIHSGATPDSLQGNDILRASIQNGYFLFTGHNAGLYKIWSHIDGYKTDDVSSILEDFHNLPADNVTSALTFLFTKLDGSKSDVDFDASIGNTDITQISYLTRNNFTKQ